MVKRIAILLTVFNRREITLKGLRSLHNAISKLPADKYKFNIYMTDDGCTDGTSEAVQDQFPEVTIVYSKGDLFWNRGMFLAWKSASKLKDFDFYLWLNDDIVLFENALDIVFSNSKSKDYKSVIVGATCDSKTKTKTTYSGYTSKRNRIPVNGELQECDYFNGNLVLIPFYVYKIVGTNDPIFHHSLGDFDYGLRMKVAGLHSFVSSCFVGVCDRHNCLPKWCDPEISFTNRWKNYLSDLGAAPRDNFIFNKRHYGVFYAIRCLSLSFLNFLFPTLFVKRNRNKEQYFSK